MAREPFDATEPPNGDFARYIEKLEQQAAAAPVSATPVPAEKPAAMQAAAMQPTATSPLPTAARAGGARLAWRPTATTADKPPLRRRSNTPPSNFRTGRAAWWLIGAGAALILLAVLPDDPMIETPLLGMVLVGAGLAIRKHFSGSRQSR